MKKPEWLHLLLQKRMLLIILLGFASGLPLGLTGTTLQAWYTVDGVSVVTIGFLALVGQPYVYKFLWAPALDKYHLPILGLRRGWMITTQIGLIAALCVIAMLSPKADPMLVGFVALVIAFLSATQDIAYDAYRTEVLDAHERGMGTSMTVTGYRLAMLVSTSLTLIMGEHLGFSITYFLMALLMGVGLIATLWAKEPTHYRPSPPNFAAACIDPFKEFLTRRHALLLLAFIVLYKLGDAFAVTLTTTFFNRGIGFTLTEIGVLNKSLGVISTLAGVFVGGVFMVKLGLFRSLFIFGIIQALTNILFYAMSIVGKHLGMMIITIILENFGAGLGTAAFMALVMSLCNPAYTATQFALLSALAAVGRVYVGPAAGYMVENLGWAEFYLWTIVFAVPGLIILWWLRDTIDGYEKQEDMIEAIAEAKAEA